MSLAVEVMLSRAILWLFIATIINCFPSRIYGEMEYRLSCLKVITIAIVSEYISIKIYTGPFLISHNSHTPYDYRLGWLIGGVRDYPYVLMESLTHGPGG